MALAYGDKNWIALWKKLEQEGNIGLDYVINPYLYPQITEKLAKTPRATVIDFGAGTNILAIQFMFGYTSSIPALKLCRDLQIARKNISRFIGLEDSEKLVQTAQEYLRDLGYPDEIEAKQFQLKTGLPLEYGKGEIDLAISRNLLMHLSIEDMEFHLQEVARVLKAKGEYILAVLNPAYELKKFVELHPNEKPPQNGDRYSYTHGEHGEHGTFFHYLKTMEQYEVSFQKSFKIAEKINCVPITDTFRKTHSRYYDQDTPMAFVYRLTPH